MDKPYTVHYVDDFGQKHLTFATEEELEFLQERFSGLRVYVNP
jgi:hypothetical protein